MSGEHEGVVAFGRLSTGRESIMLGGVQIGEISPSVDPRTCFPMCFRIDLPGTSTRAWRPARNVSDARRQVLSLINDWLIAANLRPNGVGRC